MPLTHDRLVLELEHSAPETLTHEQLHAIEDRALELAVDLDIAPPEQSWRGYIRTWILELVHPFGIHDFTRFRIYDADLDRIIDPGADRWICRNRNCR